MKANYLTTLRRELAAARAIGDVALPAFDLARDVEFRRAARAAAPCPYCDRGERTAAAIGIHNLRVAEFGERSYARIERPMVRRRRRSA